MPSSKVRVSAAMFALLFPMVTLHGGTAHAIKSEPPKPAPKPPINIEIKVPKPKETIPIVVNPSAIVNKEIAKAVEPVLVEAKSIGTDHASAKDVLKTSTAPMPTVIAVGKHTVVQLGQANWDLIKADLMLANGVIKGDLQEVGTAIRDLAGAQLDQAVNPAVVYLADVAVGLPALAKTPDLLEVPEVTLFEPKGKRAESKGLLDPKIVYYINGILTPTDVANLEAQALADHLGRPVGLIPNGTNNGVEDSVQAIYDRTWPIALAGRTGITPMGKAVQLNKTTKQVTHLLTYAKDNLSIVSHSQGGLIVRNALLTANRLRGDRWLERGIKWVASGVPLRNEEVFVKVNQYTPIANQNDFVAQGLGIRLVRNEDKQNALSGHDFREAYLKKISKQAVW